MGGQAQDDREGLAGTEISQRLLTKVRSSGRVRVIVGLNPQLQYQAETQLSDFAAKQLRREAIALEQASLLEVVAPHDVTTLAAYQYIPFIALEVDEGGLQALLASGKISSLEEDSVFWPSLDRSVPIIGADNAWTNDYDGSGQTVAILDSGVDRPHSFFGGRVVSEACYSSESFSVDGDGCYRDPIFGIRFCDFIVRPFSLCPSGSTEQTGTGAANPRTTRCLNGALNLCEHGTHVAGIAAGRLYPGFSGVANNADIIAIQVFHTRIVGNQCPDGKAPCIGAFRSDIVKGLQRVYALRNNFSIAAVNLSVGGGNYTSKCDAVFPSIKAQVDELNSVGIAVVAASGNAGSTDGISSPACISSVISVGATEHDDTVADFTNTGGGGGFLDLLAPGMDILSSMPGNDAFGSMRGTSQAAPHVTGAIALYKQQNPGASVDEVLSVLRNTGVPIHVGFGNTPRLQIDRALGVEPSPNPQPIAPAGTITDTTPTYVWTQGNTTGTQYELYVRDPSGNTVFEFVTPVCVSGECSFTRSHVHSPGDHLFWIRLPGGTLGAALAFRVEPPVIPNPISPAGIVNDTAPTYTWTQAGAETQYQLWVAGPSGVVVNQTVTASCSAGQCAFTPSTNLFAGDHRFWVRVPAGTWSTALAFRVEPVSIPNPISPAGIVNDTTPTYTWTQAGSQTQYQMWVAGPSGVVVNQTVAASCSAGQCAFTPSTNLFAGDHRFWVRVPVGTWSTSLAFRVEPVSIPDPISPAGIVNDTTPTYTWTQPVSETQYQLWVAGPSGVVVNQAITASCSAGQCAFTPSTNLSAGDYRFWVRVPAGIWSTPLAFRVEPPPVTIPDPISPAGIVNDTTPAYTWTQAGSQTQYQIWVAGPSGVVVNQTVAASCSVSQCAFAPTTVLAAGDHRYWVRVPLATWSASLAFRVEPPPVPIPDPISPAGIINDSTPTFTWTQAGSETQYQMWVASALGVVVNQTVTASCSAGQCAFTPSTVLSAGDHVWWVRVPAGTWSSNLLFTVVGRAPEILRPSPGSVLAGTSVSFAWTGNDTAVTRWWLYAGSNEGSFDLHNSGDLGTSQAHFVTGLPTDGRAVWIRLWSESDNVWHFVDYQYSAARN